MSRISVTQVLYEFYINMVSLMSNLLENLASIVINEQHALPFALLMSIGLLRTGNVLSRAMRPLLSLVKAEELYGFGEIVMRHMIELLFEIDGKDSQNLCFRAVLVGIKKALVISGLQRLLKNENKPIKN